MKKKTIWTVAIIMGLSFLALLFLQLNYIEEMAEMKKEQFDESVNRALYQASRNLELNETMRYLENYVGKDSANAKAASASRTPTSFEQKTAMVKPSQIPKAMILRNDSGTISSTKKSIQQMVRNRFVYQESNGQ